jgi:putative transposase
MIKRAYKYRIYPNKTQSQKLAMAFGCTRFVWNKAVGAFNEKQEIPSLIALKAEFTFLSDVSAAILQQKQRDFIEFKQQFFNKSRKTKVQRPRFKKKGQRDSFRLPNQKFKIVGNKIQLEKIGKIDFVQDRIIAENSKFLSVTISKNSVGQYFASVLVETTVEALPKTGKTVGCDVGLKSFLVTSNNETFDNPRYFRESQAKIKQAQRHLSRKQKGSKRYRKQKRKLAKIHLKVANQRSHFLHQITNHLVKNNDEIVIEDLNVKGMTKNRKLAKSITDASFSAFRTQLTYKCAWYGKKLTVAPRFYPSSKTCSSCGTVKQELTLKERTYDCTHCGASLDRDLNAATNLNNKAVGVHTA